MSNGILKSQSLNEYGKPLVSREAPLDDPQGSEVIIKVHHCGVCHSDLHLQDGYFDLGNERFFSVGVLHKLPFTPGHEIEGEVVAAGPEAEGVSLGSRKVVYAWIGCENCDFCKDGSSHLCNRPRQIGINVDGGYASHVRVPHPKYLLDYDGISPEHAGSFMCAGITAYSALEKLKAVSGSGPVLIFGFGGLGMMALQFAKAMFSAPPLVADVDEKKRELAVQMGAQSAFDPSDSQARRKLQQETGGFTGAVDFVGSTKSVNHAVGLLMKGGKVVVAGLYGGEFSYPLPYFPFKSLSIEGSYVGSLKDAKEMLKLVADSDFHFIPVCQKPLEKASEALDELRQGQVYGRTVLCP